MSRMNELVELLNKASKAYYQEAREIMSDREFDELYDELVKLEKETGIVRADSPTRNVGYRVLSELTKVSHPHPMLSLNKTKETEELISFVGDSTALLSYKMDGLTVVLTYRNGELENAVTRGNGEIGEDITHNALVFKNLPINIPFKDELILRGEAVISFDDFEKINDSLPNEDKYKNPRNLCSGSVRQLNSEICAKRNVNLIAFTLVSANGKDFKYKHEQLDFLDDLGFTTVKRKTVDKNNISDMVEFFEKEIPNNRFATDGLVLTFDDIEYSNSLGATSKFPRDSIAFKWRDETAETVLREISWNTSRTGLINPVAVFDPVELEGTTVSRASVHNVSIVRELKLGIGDKITVYKANMIIPQIAENITKSDTAIIPEKCPVCGSDTEIITIKEGSALLCSNPNCMAQRVMTIGHFVSRNAMNIDGFSDATTQRLIDAGVIESYPDIYTIKEHGNTIINLDGFGMKSFKNLCDAIEKSKKVKLPNFIYALGINSVGLSTARLICKHFEDDLQAVINADVEELTKIDGIGEITAQKFVRYFNDENNRDLLNRVLKYIEIVKEVNEDKKIFEGLTFVVTGKVNNYPNRKALQEDIEKHGGKNTSQISAKTSYLINNDITSSSTKNKTAKKLGIPIITEDEFIDMLKEAE
ncbi:MAG TPA: DNA ligase (NAD(+)) LigA [Lachnospiraceae bacterium]|nr:DNA ligase (NAD(+)) LigA [Lachnospiraceae bacterium]